MPSRSWTAQATNDTHIKGGSWILDMYLFHPVRPHNVDIFARATYDSGGIEESQELCTNADITVQNVP